MDLAKLVENIKGGDRMAISRAVTLVESTKTSDRGLALQLLGQLKKTKPTLRIAVSGAPGVGKSTFINALGEHVISLGMKVAVLAIDPSSATSRGSIMGDKTRMQTLGRNPNAFIRPSPSGGRLGGLSHASYECTLIFEGAGYDITLIETVGVGQSEIEARYLSDIYILLLQPAGGDLLQGMKKGVVEIADILVVNKHDGSLKILAEQTRAHYQQVWNKEGEVLLHSSSSSESVKDIWKRVEEITPNLTKNAKERRLFWFRETVKNQWLRLLQSRHKEKLSDLESQILDDKITYQQALERSLNLLH